MQFAKSRSDINVLTIVPVADGVEPGFLQKDLPERVYVFCAPKERSGLPRIMDLADVKLTEQDEIVVIGHASFTGPAARAQAMAWSKRPFAVMMHTYPPETEMVRLEYHTEPRVTTLVKMKDLEDIASDAAAVLCVGPYLHDKWKRTFRGQGKTLIRLDPPIPADVCPLSEEDIEDANKKPQVTMVGRLDDHQLKGLDIGIEAAIAHVRDCKSSGHGLPVAQLVLRGLGSAKMYAKVQGLIPRDIRAEVLPLTMKREDVVNDIRQAAVVLIPSRAEAHCLVALEAIAAEVPIVIMSRCGVAELLCDNDLLPEVAKLSKPFVCDTAFSQSESCAEKDILAWKKKIAAIVGNKDNWKARRANMNTIKKHLVAHCAKSTSDALDALLSLPS